MIRSIVGVQRPRRAGGVGIAVGEDLAQIGLDAAAGVPVLGIAQRALLESHTVPVVGGPDVEMPIDHGLGAKAQVPVRGPPGAAPDGEAGDAGEHGEVLAEGEVVDEDETPRLAASASLGSVRRTRSWHQSIFEA